MNEPVIIQSEKDGHRLEFNPKTHRYYLTIKGATKRRPVVSATTTNGGFPTSEALIKWRIKQGIEEYISGDKLQKASEIGTFSHQFFYDVEQGREVDVPKIPEVQNIVRLHGEWYAKEGKNDEVLFREQIMAHPEHMVAGTMDRMCKRDGKIILQDYKTSKGVYDSAFFQLGWYSILSEYWLGIKPDVWEILRFGKEDDDYETKKKNNPDEMEDYRQQSLRNLETYRFAAKYKP